jgi:hypothetical protein
MKEGAEPFFPPAPSGQCRFDFRTESCGSNRQPLTRTTTKCLRVLIPWPISKQLRISLARFVELPTTWFDVSTVNINLLFY